MKEFFYIVKDIHVYGMGDAECDNLTFFRTGCVLKDREDAIQFILEMRDKDETYEYSFLLVEVLSDNQQRLYPLIESWVNGDENGLWDETECEFLGLELNLLLESEIITDDDIIQISGRNLIMGTEPLLEDYFQNLTIQKYLAICVENGKLKSIKEHFIKFGTRNLNFVLCASCAEGNFKLAKYCIEQKADANFQDSLPLYLAIHSNNVQLVDFLIEQGASWLPHIKEMQTTAIGIGHPWEKELQGDQKLDWERISSQSFRIRLKIHPYQN